MRRSTKKEISVRLVCMLTVGCLLSPLVARADELRVPVPASLLSPTMPAEVRNDLIREADRRENRGRAVTTAGVVLSVIGTALTIAGPAVMLHDALCDTCATNQIPGAIAMTTIGPVAMVIGLPLAIAGSVQTRNARRARVVLTTNGLQF